jgi:hypothetical protein
VNDWVLPLVAMGIGLPIAAWATSPRRIARRIVRRLERVAREVELVLPAWSHPPPPAAAEAPASRTCAGPGARPVYAAPPAPTPATTAPRRGGRGPIAAPPWIPPTRQARHAVGTPDSPQEGVPTAPTTSGSTTARRTA